MATARRMQQDPRIEVRMVPEVTEVPRPDRIVLELSLDEAATLMMLTHVVSGQESGRRRDSTSIQDALYKAGVSGQIFHPDYRSEGGVAFRDYRVPAFGAVPVVSPTQGCGSSPIKDTACGQTAQDRKPKYWAPSSLLR